MAEVFDDIPCEPTAPCVRPLLRRAYGLFWDHAVLLVSANLVVMAVLFIGNQLLWVGGNVLIGPFLLGYYKIAIRLARNEETEISDLLSGFEYFLPAFIANILIHVMIFASLPLIVLPLLVMLTYSATYLFILEDNRGFWDAMELSRRMVWGNFRRWLAIGVAILVLNVAGALCLVVGVLVTIPYGHLVIALAYEEEMKARHATAAATETAPPGAPPIG